MAFNIWHSIISTRRLLKHLLPPNACGSARGHGDKTKGHIGNFGFRGRVSEGQRFPVGNGYSVYSSRRTGEKRCLVVGFCCTSTCKAGMLPCIDLGFFFLMGASYPAQEGGGVAAARPWDPWLAPRRPPRRGVREPPDIPPPVPAPAAAPCPRHHPTSESRCRTIRTPVVLPPETHINHNRCIVGLQSQTGALMNLSLEKENVR